MRLALISLVLLSCCGRTEPPPIALLDIADCPGWAGPRPATERQFARAAGAELSGRLCANAKLAAVRATVKE